MEPISKLAAYTLAVVVFVLLLVFFFAPGRGFAAVKSAFSEALNYYGPKVSLGAEEVKGEKPELPQEHREALGWLKNRIEKTKGQKQCFINYKLTNGGSAEGRNGLPELGKEGTSLLFQKADNDLIMIILGGVAGKQEISRETISEVNPCVISGISTVPTVFEERNTIPEDFYNTFLAATDDEPNHYNAVEKILITYDGENRISYNDGPLLDFEDGGLLYTPDGNQVCFFPTKDGDGTCDGDGSQGLDDDCLGNSGEDDLEAIPILLKKKKWEWCSS